MTAPATFDPVDIEAIVCTYLRSTMPAGTQVSAMYPSDYQGLGNFIVVDRIGGRLDMNTGWTDTADIDLHIVGPSKEAANDSMRRARGLLVGMRWATHAGGVVTNVLEIVGPQWIADPDYPRAGKYVVQVSVTAHPNT